MIARVTPSLWLPGRQGYRDARMQGLPGCSSHMVARVTWLVYMASRALLKSMAWSCLRASLCSTPSVLVSFTFFLESNTFWSCGRRDGQTHTLVLPLPTGPRTFTPLLMGMPKRVWLVDDGGRNRSNERLVLELTLFMVTMLLAVTARSPTSDGLQGQPGALITSQPTYLG